MREKEHKSILILGKTILVVFFFFNRMYIIDYFLETRNSDNLKYQHLMKSEEA